MNTSNNKRWIIPFLIVLLGSIVMLSTLLMPYASAKGEYRDTLIKYSDEIYDDEIDMTNGEAIDMSLVELAKVYKSMTKEDMYKAQGIFTVVLIVAFGVLALLTVIFAAIRKPIGVLITDVLSLGVSWLNRTDFSDRGVLPSNTYDWGIASTLVYIIGVVIIAGAIWLIVEKNIQKKNY